MNSKNLVIVWLVGLTLVVSGTVGDLKAQISLDTTYTAQGARPFDQPVDPDLYLIRPGERLEVVFLGAKLDDLQLTVNSEGRVVHRELGMFDLAGRTLTETRTILLESLQRLYNADEIVISVNAIYPVAITVSGMVKRPGTYLGYTSQRVNEMIDSAGGVAPGGSTRKISFTGGPRELEVDLDPYYHASDNSHNPCLYAGARLTVPPRTGPEVQITGAVLSPRAVELRLGESLADIVRLAGGPLPGADLNAAYLLNDSARDLGSGGAIAAGDVIVVPEAAGLASLLQVKLFGMVKQPGHYDGNDQMTLADLLRLGGGLTAEANPGRITVFRLAEPDGLGRRLKGKYPLTAGTLTQAERFNVRPGDSVYIPRLLGYVSLTGLVDRVGLVPYNEGYSVEDYLRMAGGHSDPTGRPILEVFDRISGLTRPATMRTVVYDGDQIIVRQGDQD